MNAPALIKTSLPSLAMDESELMGVLRNSLYPGAKDESIKLVISYCKASGLDPMQKPVHIVPMSVATGRKDGNGYDIKEMRDVVMPGIGLYRTQAARSGEYAGVSEPEFGDDVQGKLGEAEIIYPKWCKVTVKRLMPNGAIVDFTAKELWVENYATKSNKSQEPNAMWKKRPYAQLAKCAEAQALRKAFPEFGSQPTADEMEGKEIDVTPQPSSIANKEPEFYSDDEFAANENAWRKVIDNGKEPERFIAFIEANGKAFSEAQKTLIKGWKKQPSVIDGEATKVDDDFVKQMDDAESEASK